MKKKLIYLLLFVFVFSFSTFAEPRDEEMDNGDEMMEEQVQKPVERKWDVSKKLSLMDAVKKAIKTVEENEQYKGAVPILAKLSKPSKYNKYPQYEVRLQVDAEKYVKVYVQLNGRTKLADRRGKLYDVNFKSKKRYKNNRYNKSGRYNKYNNYNKRKKYRKYNKRRYNNDENEGGSSFKDEETEE